MSYSIKDIVQILDARLLNPMQTAYEIEHLLLDSRQVIFPKTALFFALKGQRQDGHQYIANLFDKGVRNFIISSTLDSNLYPEANFILVENTLASLQKLATHHRRQFALKTIGITGSNGKTIIKEWLFHLLTNDYKIVRSPKSYNSQIGVPLSVWQIKEGHQLGIFEAGISEMDEMKKLAPIIDCEIGIFTNIGDAHDEGFPDMEEKIRQKLQLFQHTSTLIYNKDSSILDQTISEHFNGECLTWSTSKKADFQIKKIESTEHSTTIEGVFHNQKIKFTIPFSDQASIENSIHCYTCLLHLGIAPKTIEKRIKKLEPVAMRLEQKAGINNCTLINDSYNSDLQSLTIALHFLDQQSSEQKRTLILSDILQSGQNPVKLYQEVADLLKEKNINRLIGIGPDISLLEKKLPANFKTEFYKNTTDFLAKISNTDFQNEVILLKGARQFQFEHIANRLARKAHKTVLEIDLNALLHNLNVYSQQLQNKTKMMVMVKAAAYGSGSYEIAKLLEFHQVDYLSVAYADEGVELRKAGIQLPIMVLNPEEATFDAFFRYQLEPEIYSIQLLKHFLAQMPKNTKDFPIHLKLDTGMNRLGFTQKDLPQLLKILQKNSHVKVQSIFSHLAASEEAIHDGFSEQQVQKFQELYQSISHTLQYSPDRHILNSSGIARFPQYQMEMVRLGIGLYGIDTSEQLSEQLKVVHTLKATISQIKEVHAGQTIGYGRKGKVSKKMRSATISIGYADGLLRKAGNGRYHFNLHQQKAPIIGNVCMDMCMIDVSQIPQANEGDEVIIFGKDMPVTELAKCFETIVYEVFTGISERVKRVYFQE